MQKLILFVFLVALYSCSNSPLRLSAEAEKNKANMMDVQTGMTRSEVQELMGEPYRMDKTTFEHIEYIVWFYITKEVLIDQTRIIAENLTPFVFYKNKLIGTGWFFYHKLFYPHKKHVGEERSGFPLNEHQIITPYEQKPEEEAIKILEEKPTQSIETIQPQKQEETAPQKEHEQVEKILKEFIEKEPQEITPQAVTPSSGNKNP